MLKFPFTIDTKCVILALRGDMDMGNFAQILRGLRAQQGWTQPQLAQRLGVSRSTVSMYERGEREPDFAMLDRIADLFGVDANQLLGRAASADTDDYANQLFAAYGEVKESFDQEDIDDVKLFMRMVAERKRQKGRD